MSESELEKACQTHRAALKQLTIQIHEYMASAISGITSKDMNHILVFEGFTAFKNPQGDFQVDIGEFRWETMTKELRLESLRLDLKKAIYQVKSFKEEMTDIISFAGDIDQDDIDSLRAQVVIEIRGTNWRDTSMYSITISQHFRQLARQNKFQFDVKQTPDSYEKTDKGLKKRFGTFSVSMATYCEEEILIKIDLEFNTRLLQLYKSRFAILTINQKVMFFALRIHALGQPFVRRIPEKVEKGYLTIGHYIEIVEGLIIEYRDGSVFEGRSINGVAFGKGSMRLPDGSLFKGEIFDETKAKGEIIEGKRALKSSFRIVTSPSGQKFYPDGKTERFLDGKLVGAGVTFEDESFFGWIKDQDFEMVGQWDSSGKNFTGKKISLVYSAEGSFCKGLLEGNGKAVSQNLEYEGNFLHGKYHGHGKSTQGSIQTIGKWLYGEIIYGSFICESESYFGLFKDGQYHGRGKLKMNDEFYEGEFACGKYHGQGTLKLPNATITGNFVEGKAYGMCTYREGELVLEGTIKNGYFCGFGKMKTPDFTYEGEFLNNEKHGKGKQVQKDLTYIGDFEHDILEGHGILIYQGITLEGPFSNGMLNGYVTVKPEFGLTRLSFFKDGIEQ